MIKFIKKIIGKYAKNEREGEQELVTLGSKGNEPSVCRNVAIGLVDIGLQPPEIRSL